MTEPPGARLRVALTGLTVAIFRDEEGATRCFHRQHFRSSGGIGSFRAARPHAQRRWVPAEPGHRNGRVAGTDHLDEKGSVTSVQAIYVPADDPTDPAPATTLPTPMPPRCFNAH
jgi:F-type H+-transporting ATPase subunit beta